MDGRISVGVSLRSGGDGGMEVYKPCWFVTLSETKREK